MHSVRFSKIVIACSHSLVFLLRVRYFRSPLSPPQPLAQYGTTVVIWNVEMVPNIALVYIYLRYLVGGGEGAEKRVREPL